MKMRELEKLTGVNRETIRVYLRHGLVPEPERPKPNVADYGDNHVRAIMAVRDLQRESALTLKQISSLLKGNESGRHVDAGAFQNLEALVATRVGVDDRKVQIASLLSVWPNSEDDAKVFAELGLIEILDTAGGPALSVTDSRLLTIWGDMRAAGYKEDLGFGPEIVSFYREPAETIARAESQLFLERVEGKMDEQQAAEMFQAGIRLMIDFFSLLRTKALLRNLHEGLPADHAVVRLRQAKGPPK